MFSLDSVSRNQGLSLMMSQPHGIKLKSWVNDVLKLLTAITTLNPYSRYPSLHKYGPCVTKEKWFQVMKMRHLGVKSWHLFAFDNVHTVPFPSNFRTKTRPLLFGTIEKWMLLSATPTHTRSWQPTRHLCLANLKFINKVCHFAAFYHVLTPSPSFSPWPILQDVSLGPWRVTHN